MKHLISLALLCFIFNASQAQINNFNMTSAQPGSCNIYIEVYGSNGGCGTGGTDMAVLIVPAGFPPTNFPIASLAWTGAPPTYIDYIRVYEADPNFCSGAAFIDLGEPCMSLPVHGTLNRYDNTCSTCGAPGIHPIDWNRDGIGGVMVELN